MLFIWTIPNTKYIMKKIMHCLILALFIIISIDLNAQIKNNYQIDELLSNKEATIELKENIYRQLIAHPLVENKRSIKVFYVNNYDKYDKMLLSFLEDKKEISSANMNREVAGIINTVIADFNREKLYSEFKKEHALSNNNDFSHKKENDKGPGDPCINMDFGNCDYTGWNLTQGMVNTIPFGFINPVPTTNWGNGQITGFPPPLTAGTSHPDQHFIVGSGTDPNAPIQMLSPFGTGTCSSLLGDGSSSGGRASRMSQTFMVDAGNANFSYSYAAVLEDPGGHTVGEMPYFMVNIFDSSGDPIPCSNFQSTAGDGSSGWILLGSIQYRDWTLVTVPLQAYIGQDVTIEFTSGDCELTAHYGYAYVEAKCNLLEITASNISCGDTIILAAPTPYNGTYLWNTGETTSSITITTPGTYSVDLISTTGCSSTLNIAVVGDNTLPVAHFITDTVCMGGTTTFTDLSTISTGTIMSWEWDFDNNGIIDATTQNPTYTYSTSGTHTVTLTVTSAYGCTSTANSSVTIIGPIANFTSSGLNPGSPTIFTDLSNPNGTTITSWQWDFGDGNSSNLPSPSNTYASSGIYIVTLTVSDGNCTSTKTDTINMMITSIPEHDDLFTIYPNPNNGTLYITNKSSENITDVVITNVNGDVVYQYKNKDNFFNSKKVEIKNVANGNYFIKIRYENSQLITKKILITK